MTGELAFGVGLAFLLALGIAGYLIWATVLFVRRAFNGKLTDGKVRTTGVVHEVFGFLTLAGVLISLIVFGCMSIGYLFAPLLGL